MRLLDLTSTQCSAIREFSSSGAASAELAAGAGEAHCHVVRFDADGHIGPHPAGFGQLFVVLSGTAWVAGEDARRVSVTPGQAMLIERGEIHSKGASDPVLALIVQVRDLALSGTVPVSRHSRSEEC